MCIRDRAWPRTGPGERAARPGGAAPPGGRRAVLRGASKTTVEGSRILDSAPPRATAGDARSCRGRPQRREAPDMAAQATAEGGSAARAARHTEAPPPQLAAGRQVKVDLPQLPRAAALSAGRGSECERAHCPLG
eukprot:12678834-Alexandrium_andersonii.AAC.1